MKSPMTVSCDMTKECLRSVAYVDNKGYAYCAEHGKARKWTHPTRKLQTWEVKALERGEQITYDRNTLAKHVARLEQNAWNEYDRAAEDLARKGKKGKVGDALPLMSARAVGLINHDPEAFEQRVRLHAYALSMAGIGEGE